jgi:hypothetical protein
MLLKRHWAALFRYHRLHQVTYDEGRYRSCRTNRCSSLFLSRTAALLTILPGSHGFCGASGLAASHTHVACHPPLRTEDAFEQCRQIKVGIEFREVQPIARGRDLNLGELFRRRMLQPLCISGRKEDA